MVFLNPGFLWFLPLSFIPLIIHLLNLHPYKKVYFSNTRLLVNIEQQYKTRTKLKEILVLLMRMLAIAALVIAFARPVKFLGHKPCSSVGIYLDNSFSMNSEGKEGINLEIAKKRAFEITTLFPPNTKFIFLTNDLSLKQQRLYSEDIVKNLIAQTEATGKLRKLQFIVQKLSNFLSTDSTCKPFVFLLSDFQKSTVDIIKTEFPKNWQIFLVPIQPNQTQNLSIDTAFFPKPYHSINMKDSIVFTIKNHSDRPVHDLRVTLFIDDTLRGINTINLPPNSTTTSYFAFENIWPKWNKCYIEIDDYPVTFDNTLYFSYYVRNKFKILLITTEENKYLQVFYSQKPFELKTVSPTSIPYSEFSHYSLIILNQLNQFSSGLLEELKNYLNRGGAVILFPSGLDSTNQILSYLGLPQFTSIDTTKHTISFINLKSQIYKNAISSYESNELLPKINKLLVRTPDFAKEQPLLNCGGTTVLSDASIGKGHLYIFSFIPDKKVTNFFIHPIVAPTLYNMAIFSGNSFPIYFTLSRDIYLTIPGIYNYETIKLIGKNKTFIPPARNIGNDLLIDLSHEDLQAGNYELYKDDSLLSYISLNYSRKESDLTFYTPSELEKIIKERKLKNVQVLSNQAQEFQSTLQAQTSEKKLWKIFLILALVFLTLEIVFNRLL